MLISPLFSFLDSAEFANLVSLLELKRIAPNTTIMREGDPGECLSIIARGRVLIYCKNYHGNKVYLSSLSDGDCFGEFSFFTGEPRAATVEALEEVLLFEIQHKDFDTILDRFPNLTNALLRFYKSRVVATLLAKSEVFGVLRAKDREWLLERLKLEHHARGKVIIREGDKSDGFYLIKSGEVEVYTERAGGYVFLNKLKSGEFFGEIAAVTGELRSASVRALGPCELLRFADSDIQELLRSTPEVHEILRSHIALREAETARRLTAGGALI
jgi:CRP-like cAMP-binding protein